MATPAAVVAIRCFVCLRLYTTDECFCACMCVCVCVSVWEGGGAKGAGGCAL